MKVVGKNIIGYESSEHFDLQFKTLNPKLGVENDFRINETSEEDLQSALKKAQAAFLPFSLLSGAERAYFLRLIAEKLALHKQQLIEMYQLESALPESRAQLELNRTIHQLREFSTLISKDGWNVSAANPGESKPALHKVYKALGPVVVFGASNFPFAYSTIGGDSASALAAGCPVIVKSHYMHAGTGDLVAQLVVEAAKESGMPDGVFSNLNSKGIELGQKLVLHPTVKAVGFTGSFSGGMALYKLAQQRNEPIPVFAEMGSVNPVFIFPDGYIYPYLALDLAQSIALNAGQFCTNPGLIFVLKSPESEKFTRNLVELLSNQVGQTMLHPKIKENYQLHATYVDEHQSTNKLIETKNTAENLVYPKLNSISYADFRKDTRLQEEVFGMHTLLVVCEDFLELKDAIENLQGQLTGSIFSSESELMKHQDLLQLLACKVGRIIFNGVPTGVQVTKAMHHGGPFPASTDSRFTAVGSDAIFRFLRPVVFQNFSTKLLHDLST